MKTPKYFIGVRGTMYLQSLGVSTSRFTSRCILSDPDLYKFYSDPYQKHQGWQLISLDEPCDEIDFILREMRERIEMEEARLKIDKQTFEKLKDVYCK